MVIGIVLLFSTLGCIYGQINAVTPHFSIEVPNNWVYRENFGVNNNVILTPNEFAKLLIADNASASVVDVIEHGIVAELGLDPDFDKKNASLEEYVKHFSSFAQNYDPKYENATIGGERAIKVFINGTDIGRTSPMKNLTSSINSISYLVMHQDQPYYLYYIANANHYNKYLPFFEQIVKTIKFVK
jgi:hypothetical protein